jgi:acyl-homoserine-lactone acylase
VRRSSVLLTALALLAGIVLALPAQAESSASAPASPGSARQAPFATGAAVAADTKTSRYRATITRTKYGIPHIRANTFGSLGFGHGYATGQTNLCNLLDTVISGRGERSLWFGPHKRYEDQVTLNATNLQSDTLFTDIRNRRVAEKLISDRAVGPSRQVKALVKGYVAGVNRYIRDIGGKKGVKDPQCRNKGYVKPDIKPMDLYYGIYAANLLASAGVFVPGIAEANPPTIDDPGLPVRATPAFAEVPAVLPTRDELLKALGKDPNSAFGSNAWAVGKDLSKSGGGMLLGNPHFPWRGRYRFEQVQLTIPGKYNVAGGSLIGSPVVNIGFNKNVAWSHTVSTAFRFTPYEYKLLPGQPTTYLTEGGPTELEHRVFPVKVRGGKTVQVDVYRTNQGYVVEDAATLQTWTPSSFFAIREANGEHLRTLDVFHEMGKAKNVRDLLRRQDQAAGMPWVNTIAADRFGDVLYADHSVVPNVPDSLVDQCATPVGLALYNIAGLPGLDGTRAESDCAWLDDEDASRPGMFGPANLPESFRKDWVINANDSYWLPNEDEKLEGFANIIGCEPGKLPAISCERTLRTRLVMRYVMDAKATGKKISARKFRSFEHQNRVFGAEVMRENGDLDAVCAATSFGGGEACQVLAAWDGHSDATSRGNHLFEEFVARLPADPWEVPFDADDPVNTPRDLDESNADVIDAMDAAIARFTEEGVPFDAPWGRFHVAGDDNASPIPLGGGSFATGNANALVSESPVANKDRLVPVTYGSSHIQAVAYGRKGRLNARTILTYGQATDPTSPFHQDQTKLFSRERWVRWAFTTRQIRKGQISMILVTGRRP